MDRNVYKTANKGSASIHTNQILLSSNRLELSPWSFTYVFKKIETTIRWYFFSKALRFLQLTIEHQDCPVFTVFLTIKTPSENISITLLQFTFKLHELQGEKGSRERFWKNSSQCREIGLQAKYVMASFCCYDNSHVILTLIITNFHLLSNTAVVVIFQIFVNGSNLGGIDPEKPYRTTLTLNRLYSRYPPSLHAL